MVEYEIKDGSLVFKDLCVGNLKTGKPLSWEELREVLITATRFGTKRPLIKRSLKELNKDVRAFIDDKVKKEKESDREVNNLRVQLAASQDYIEQQNIQYNELRKAYNEVTGVVSKPEKRA